MNKISILILLVLFSSCVTKRSNINSDRNIEQSLTVIDSSKAVQKIELDKQYISTQISERKVTFYAVKFDTIYIDSTRYINPIYYPDRVEEERNTDIESERYRLSFTDSLMNALLIKYDSILTEKFQKNASVEPARKVGNIYILLVVGFLLLLIGVVFKSFF